MNTQVIMVRVGTLDPELSWMKVAAFCSDAVTYVLLRSQSRLNEEHVNYLLEISVEDTVIRRARIGMITSTTKGLSYEFINSAHDAMINWFLSLKMQYMNNGDDWFTMAMTLGEMYYTTGLNSLAALAFETEQRRSLLKINPNFAITFNRLDNIIAQEAEEDDTQEVRLDDIWMEWDDEQDTDTDSE